MDLQSDHSLSPDGPAHVSHIRIVPQKRLPAQLARGRHCGHGCCQQCCRPPFFSMLKRRSACDTVIFGRTGLTCFPFSGVGWPVQPHRELTCIRLESNGIHECDQAAVQQALRSGLENSSCTTCLERRPMLIAVRLPYTNLMLCIVADFSCSALLVRYVLQWVPDRISWK